VEFMGKAISDEELQLKKRARRRLVGAIALVLLIVVFLPMVLDNEPRPLNQDIAITIPPVPKPESAPSVAAPAQSQSGPQSGTAPASPAVAGMPNGAPAPGAAAPANAEPTRPGSTRPEPARPDSKSALRTAPKEPKSPSVTVSADEEAFVVQLGAFSNAANAKALQKKLRDNKFKAYTEFIKSAGGDRVRVRVGPYPSREAAEKARERLKSMKLVIGEAAVVRRD
jgi:DedD protein